MRGYNRRRLHTLYSNYRQAASFTLSPGPPARRNISRPQGLPVDMNSGDYVVVKNGKGEATLKQLKKYGNTFVLHPLNPRYQDMEVIKGEFQIIGKVVKKKKRY